MTDIKVHPNWYREEIKTGKGIGLPPRSHLYNYGTPTKKRKYHNPNWKNNQKAGPRPKKALTRGTMSPYPAKSDVLPCPKCKRPMTGRLRIGYTVQNLAACLSCNPHAVKWYCPPYGENYKPRKNS